MYHAIRETLTHHIPALELHRLVSDTDDALTLQPSSLLRTERSESMALVLFSLL